MDFKKLTDEAKDLVDKRGGTDSVKEDAEEVKDIFSGKGSLTDKAKEAAEALKDPGAEGPDGPAAAKQGKSGGDQRAQAAKSQKREAIVENLGIGEGAQPDQRRSQGDYPPEQQKSLQGLARQSPRSHRGKQRA